MIYQHTRRTIAFESFFREKEYFDLYYDPQLFPHSYKDRLSTPRFKRITIEDPSTMLRATCSFIREEYQRLFKNIPVTVKIDFTWFRAYDFRSSIATPRSFWRLGTYLKNFGSPSKAMEKQLRNATSINLHFEVPRDSSVNNWFEAWREALDPNRKFWDFIHRSVPFRHAFRKLAITENLYISCDRSQSTYSDDQFHYGSEDEDADDDINDTSSESSETSSTSDGKVIFKATESDSPLTRIAEGSLYISCDLFQPLLLNISDDTRSDAALKELLLVPKEVLFRATETHFEDAWEGLEMEQIDWQPDWI
ncbi:hypothetical protein MBLNU457_5017t1 [Dothideomycetes sp. NU457]